MSFYHDLILDHYRNPRNFGRLSDATISIREENIGCGDEIEIFLSISHHPLSIRQMMWCGRGCAIATAAASLLSEHISQLGQISQIRQINDRNMVDMLGGDIGPSRMKCATLALRALHQAIGKIS